MSDVEIVERWREVYAQLGDGPEKVCIVSYHELKKAIEELSAADKALKEKTHREQVIKDGLWEESRKKFVRISELEQQLSAAETRAALWEKLAGERVELLKVANATIDAMAKELADLKEKR